MAKGSDKRQAAKVRAGESQEQYYKRVYGIDVKTAFGNRKPTEKKGGR